MKSLDHLIGPDLVVFTKRLAGSSSSATSFFFFFFFLIFFFLFKHGQFISLKNTYHIR